MTDDTHLIEQLRDAMHAHTDDAEVPDRFVEHARRTARRRTARRAAAAGVPLLTAAGLATALVAGGGWSRGSPRTASVPQVSVGAGQAHDAAFVVGKVKADVAADGHHGIVTSGIYYPHGQVSPRGALTHLAGKQGGQYTYTAPDGAVYWHSDSTTSPFEESDVWLPTTDGRYMWTGLLINGAQRTYSEGRRVVASPFSLGPRPNIVSRPSAVRRALQDGRFSLTGTTTIDGTRAITLSATLPATKLVSSERLVLYVDAQTYQPLRTADGYARRFGLTVEDWLPATSENIAKAKDRAIPAGYTRVARAY